MVRPFGLALFRFVHSFFTSHQGGLIMRQDKSAVDVSVLREAKHRADCSDFYCNPDDAYIGFRAPLEIVDALEGAAQRAGRTWNEQLSYVIHVCQDRERV